MNRLSEITEWVKFIVKCLLFIKDENEDEVWQKKEEEKKPNLNMA